MRCAKYSLSSFFQFQSNQIYKPGDNMIRKLSIYHESFTFIEYFGKEYTNNRKILWYVCTFVSAKILAFRETYVYTSLWLSENGVSLENGKPEFESWILVFFQAFHGCIWIYVWLFICILTTLLSSLLIKITNVFF